MTPTASSSQRAPAANAAGAGSADHPLALVLTRMRTRPSIRLRSDAELSLVRAFDLPTARSFGVEGQARLSPRASDDVIDRVLGVTAGDGSTLVSTSSRRPNLSPAAESSGPTFPPKPSAE